MKTYRIEFTGRAKNALGITYRMTEIRRGENEEAAILALYDDFEHIHVSTIKEA